MSLVLSHPALQDIALMSKDETLGRMQRWKLKFLSFASKVTGCYEHILCWTIFVFQGECKLSQTREYTRRTMWLWIDFLMSSFPRATWFIQFFVRLWRWLWVWKPARQKRAKGDSLPVPRHGLFEGGKMDASWQLRGRRHCFDDALRMVCALDGLFEK